MKRYIFLLAAAAISLGTVAVAATAATDSRSSETKAAAPTTSRARVQKALDAVVAAGAPGAVLLMRKGTHRVIMTAGLADLRHGTPMRAGDRFRIGSLTKSFIATIVLQLVRERRLTLNDNIEQWLPGLVPAGAGITIRELLNHTSGLFDYPNDQKFLQKVLRALTHTWSATDLIHVATAHKPLFAPGTKWSYCNTEYIVLGLIIEKATRHSVRYELVHRIIKPLGLRHTSFPSGASIDRPHAHGYLFLGKPPLQDATTWSASFAGAAGGLTSTAADVDRFYQTLFSGRLLDPSQLRQMESTVASLPGQRYGLGLEQDIPSHYIRCSTVWGHDGDFPGYHSEAFTSRDGRHSIVLLVNEMLPMLSPKAQHAVHTLVSTAYCSQP
jgi:D-alanyl-D-alanine carboxypeptidase